MSVSGFMADCTVWKKMLNLPPFDRRPHPRIHDYTEVNGMCLDCGLDKIGHQAKQKKEHSNGAFD